MLKFMRKHRRQKYENPPISTIERLTHRVKQFILHLRLWKWAAVHSPYFKEFEIGYANILRFTANYYPHSHQPYLVEMSVNRPMFYLFEPVIAVEEFCKIHDLPTNAIHQDIPF